MPDLVDVRAAFAMLPADRRKLILRSMRKALLKASLLIPVTLPARVPVHSSLIRSEGR